MMLENIARAAHVIRKYNSIAVLTGAGVSRESGIPTFRDAQVGLWARYNPQELATYEAFTRHPKLIWDWYTYRRAIVKNVTPNPGHYAIARLEQLKPETVVVTQNVDELHEIAGSKEVVHLHGLINQNRCSHDCQGYPTLIDIDSFAWNVNDGPPRCPHCGAYVRPNVTWMGEALPLVALNRAWDIAKHCDVMVVVGTSGMISPASLLPNLAHSNGAIVIEINPDVTPISRVANIRLAGKSGEVLPELVEAVANE